jgi:hypothetical protein
MTKKKLIKWLKKNHYDSVAINVEHDDFETLDHWLSIKSDSEDDFEFDKNIRNYMRLRKLSQIEKAG